MTRIVEDRHAGEPWLLWKLGNWTSIDDSFVLSIGLAWLFTEKGVWRLLPRITGNTSLFYNAVFFIRITTIGLFLSVRWGSSLDKKSLFQCGIGWKLNGRFGLTLRIQSDKTSAEGVTGPNLGQAQGFEYGTH